MSQWLLTNIVDLNILTVPIDIVFLLMHQMVDEPQSCKSIKFCQRSDGRVLLRSDYNSITTPIWILSWMARQGWYPCGSTWWHIWCLCHIGWAWPFYSCHWQVLIFVYYSRNWIQLQHGIDCFTTKNFHRWEITGLENLPKFMKICFTAINNIVDEMAQDIKRHNGLDILPYLRKVVLFNSFLIELGYFMSILFFLRFWLL